MASNGVEDLKRRASHSALASGARSAAVLVPNGHGSPHPLDRKRPMTPQPRSPVAKPSTRAGQDQPLCVSGISPHRAYICVPASGPGANGVWNAGASRVNGAGDGGSVSDVALRSPQPSGAPLTASQNPCGPEPAPQGCRTPLPVDPLRLRSGLLGKRAFSPQPSAYPTSPSPPKATSQASPVVTESSMPTNQSSPWSNAKLRDGGDGIVRPTTAKVPSHPRQGRGDLGKPTPVPSLTPLHRENGGKTEPGLTHPPTPSQEQYQDLVQNHSWGGEARQRIETVATDAGEAEGRSGCLVDRRGSAGPEKLRKSQPQVSLTAAVQKLTASAAHLRNGTVKALTSSNPSVLEVVGRAPPCSPSHAPPGKTSPLCLTNGTAEPSCIPMEVSSAARLDARSCGRGALPPAARAGAIPGDGPSGRASPQQPSVYSVTTQISAIHLTKDSAPLPEDQGCPSPPLEEQRAMTPDQETVAMLREDGEEEELPDGLEDHCSGDDDDGSEASSMNDASSVNDTSSVASMVVLSNVEEPATPDMEDNRPERPALVPSLFPSFPPTLYFSTAAERVELLPAEQRRLLKWKISSVTPNVVKQTIARSHFRVTKRSHDWLGCWGHHMKSPGFRAILEHQKLNHFPGSFQIGRKDRLWRNLSKMQAHFGKREFSFFPRSFVLPQDIKQLRKAWEEGGSRQKWIIKPPASARGIGIQVIHRWSQMPRRRPLLVQKYLHKPYLISGNKFDLRIYVYVSSYDPLRIYVFTDGLVRFASCKYSSSMKSLSNKFMHLTNYSVNKKNSEYQSNSDDKACQGHKWALKALWQYLGAKGVNTTVIWDKIKDIVIKTIIASDPYVNALLKMHVHSPYSCHELFGFDIMLDENLKPWLLEVNISPSLHSSTALDVSIKGQMIRDVLNLAGFVLPHQEDLDLSSSSSSSLCGGATGRVGHTSELSTDEKIKRAAFLSQRFADQEFLSSVLDVLTPGDVRALAETEDELTRRGEFERVFPSPTSSRYLRFFEHPRYLNILLSQWEQKHWQNRAKGVDLLRSLCQKGVHLGNTSDPAHLWSSRTSCGQRFDPCSNPSPKHDPIRSSVVISKRRGSQGEDEDSPQEDLWSVTSSLSDIGLLGSPSPGPAGDSPHPTDSA
ncbi:tubulin polyglutamylase TTLL4-like [Megalops cyprinoides]|uniref:tubulin polyglutamylase TTLL4-like n=1 Tax=Megalops cyprinoides TaxID=118141 RepID=UPI001863BD12|nr:tubulin polyglutamylase TTLL4-like [Megalops cyprinoides]